MTNSDLRITYSLQAENILGLNKVFAIKVI